MPVLLPETILKVQRREMHESSMKLDVLALLLSKPAQFLTEIPSDWAHCVHVDMPAAIDPDTGTPQEWLDPETQIRPMISNLISYMVTTGRTPIDYCAVKRADGTLSIVFRTAEPCASDEVPNPSFGGYMPYSRRHDAA